MCCQWSIHRHLGGSIIFCQVREIFSDFPSVETLFLSKEMVLWSRSGVDRIHTLKHGCKHTSVRNLQELPRECLIHVYAFVCRMGMTVLSFSVKSLFSSSFGLNRDCGLRKIPNLVTFFRGVVSLKEKGATQVILWDRQLIVELTGGGQFCLTGKL